MVGLNIPNLDASEAAITHQARTNNTPPPIPLKSWSSPYGYTPMIWPNGRNRLACATMFTLFYAGDVYTPGLNVEGVAIQEFLQTSFIKSMQKVAERLANLPHVLGYGSLNEPTSGYVGLKSLKEPLPVHNSAPCLTAFETMYIPAGFTCKVPWIERSGTEQIRTGEVILNPFAISAWKEPIFDLWRQYNVWDLDQKGNPHLLRDDYFSDIDFNNECLLPFIHRYANAIRTKHENALIFLEGQPEMGNPIRWDSNIPVINANHWYDLLTLFTKHYVPESELSWRTRKIIQGAGQLQELYIDEIAKEVEYSKRYLNDAPTLMLIPMKVDTESNR